VKLTGLAMQRFAFVALELGPVAWAGAVALAAALVLVAIVVPVYAHRGDALTSDIADARAQLERLQHPSTTLASRDPVAGLLATLPPDTDVPDFMAALQRRAEEGAVQIDRTEYRVQLVLGHAARRYRLSFPAHVDYPHLRTWLEGLIRDYPGLSVDELSLRREVDGGEELEAHVGISFLARTPK